MLHLVEVPLAQAEEDRAVDLRVAAHVVLRVRPERDAVLVVPTLRGDVALAAEDLLGVPVLRLSWHVTATFQEQDPLARRRQPVGERAAARAGADDDDVVVVVDHGVSSGFRRGRSGTSRRPWRRAASGG